MKRLMQSSGVLILLLAFIFVSCEKPSTSPVTQGDLAGTLQKQSGSSSGATWSVFYTGLNSPRGLKFGPDGYLYVAEGGTGGSNSTEGQCDQVVPPIGPYKGGLTARISKINPDGSVRTTVIENLPSSMDAQEHPAIMGVADVAFVGDQLYAVLAGGGCSHGNSQFDNSVIKVNSDGSYSTVANLSEWLKANPVAHPEPDDFEPDGTWYTMVSVRGNLYAVEANHGVLAKISPTGNVKRVLDFSAHFGHIVPTSIAYHGNFYVGNLDTFPIQGGTSSLYKVTQRGFVKKWATGFSTIVGLVIDHRGQFYVLEMTTGNPFPTPATGDIVRVSKGGKKETVVTGLTFPTGMTLGPDGNLYVSNLGFGGPPGSGQIVKVSLPNMKGSGHHEGHGHDGDDDQDDDGNGD